jgi:hypothetical protein
MPTKAQLKKHFASIMPVKPAAPAELKVKPVKLKIVKGAYVAVKPKVKKPFNGESSLGHRIPKNRRPVYKIVKTPLLNVHVNLIPKEQSPKYSIVDHGITNRAQHVEVQQARAARLRSMVDSVNGRTSVFFKGVRAEPAVEAGLMESVWDREAALKKQKKASRRLVPKSMRK